MQLLKRLALPALWLLLIAAGLFFILYFIRSKPQNNPASAEQKNDSGSAEQQKNPSAEPKNDSASAEQQKSPSTEHKNDSASAEQQKNPSTEHKNDSSPTAGPPQAGTQTPLPDNPKDMSQVVLMGNSCLLSLKDYSALPDSRIYAKVGLTVTKLLDCTDPQSAKTYSQIIESGGFEKLVSFAGQLQGNRPRFLCIWVQGGCRPPRHLKAKTRLCLTVRGPGQYSLRRRLRQCPLFFG